jgi:hypothetical protein
MECQIEMGVAGLGSRALDVEIYRRSVVPEEATAGGTLEPYPGIKHIGTASQIAEDAGDLTCFHFIKAQVEHCVLNHPGCSRGGPSPVLPDRIIWVAAWGASSSGIRLVETQRKQRGPYLALSYCWGPVSPSTFLTTTATLAARKAGIALDDLPPLFQDVVSVARMLRFDYVWIDRLCILQDSSTDFSRQAPKMGAYFGNATLTLAAGSAVGQGSPNSTFIMLIFKYSRLSATPSSFRATTDGAVTICLSATPS